MMEILSCYVLSGQSKRTNVSLICSEYSKRLLGEAG